MFFFCSYAAFIIYNRLFRDAEVISSTWSRFTGLRLMWVVLDLIAYNVLDAFEHESAEIFDFVLRVTRCNPHRYLVHLPTGLELDTVAVCHVFNRTLFSNQTQNRIQPIRAHAIVSEFFCHFSYQTTTLTVLRTLPLWLDVTISRTLVLTKGVTFFTKEFICSKNVTFERSSNRIQRKCESAI